jgi:alkylhydroperoxidase family enzyme
VIARDQAPAAFTAWDELVDAIASTTSADLLEQARAISRACLDPTAPVVPKSDASAFAAQMVVDVASMTTDLRAAGLAELGADAPAFVLAVWTEDMIIRAGGAFREMFGEDWRPIPTLTRIDPWAAHERFLLEVAKLSALDPVTSELIRLRGARAHDCRLCQSRRNVTAIDLAGGPDVFDDRDPSGISDAQSVALQVVEAVVWQPIRWPPGLGAQAADVLGPAAATELILDIVRNAANKIAVAFGVDAPLVETGVEYYDIDVSTGELRYDVSPRTPFGST